MPPRSVHKQAERSTLRDVIFKVLSTVSACIFGTSSLESMLSSGGPMRERAICAALAARRYHCRRSRRFKHGRYLFLRTELKLSPFSSQQHIPAVQPTDSQSCLSLDEPTSLYSSLRLHESTSEGQGTSHLLPSKHFKPSSIPGNTRVPMLFPRFERHLITLFARSDAFMILRERHSSLRRLPLAVPTIPVHSRLSGATAW